MDREKGDTAGVAGVSHSVSLMKDLEELEARVENKRLESKKTKESVVWSEVENQKQALVQCLQ